MKNLLWIFFVCFLFFSSPAFAHQPIKVAVMPWSINLYIQSAVENGILQRDEGLLDEVMGEIEQTIASIPGMEMSSMTFGDTAEDAAKFLFSQGGVPIPNRSEVYDADVVVLMKPAETEPDKFTSLELMGVETGKSAVTLIDDAQITNENLASRISTAVAAGAALAKDLVTVQADDLLDPERSIVRYAFTTPKQGTLFVDVDYDGEHNHIQNVALVPADIADSETIYRLPTDQGAEIIVTVFTKDHQVTRATIDTDYRPTANDSPEQSIFLVSSDQGFPLKLTFTWKEKGIENVNISPRYNPYAPLDPMHF